MFNAKPLAVRAQERRVELQRILDQLPETDLLHRDVVVALSAIDALLAANSDQLAAVMAADLSQLLDNTRYLAEPTPVPTAP